jgi:hypothetical protein
MNSKAPIFTDAYALCQWLLEHLDQSPGVMAHRICRTALAVLETLTLALKGRQRDLRLEEADEQLISLRLLLRLANSTDLITDAQLLHALDYTDRIGRQLGGWQRALEKAS